MINRENSIKLLFEFNKVINEQKIEKTEENEIKLGFLQDNKPILPVTESLLENNKVSFQISRYEPLLFREFREFCYKQEFFIEDNCQLIRELSSNYKSKLINKKLVLFKFKKLLKQINRLLGVMNLYQNNYLIVYSLFF